MKPIVTKGTNSIFGQDGFAKLPAQLYIEGNMMGEGETECIQTVWELSDEDMKVIQETRRIYVSTVGNQPQPINVDVIPFVED